MNAILGRIVSVSPLPSTRTAKTRKLPRVRVQFKAAALLPERSDVPAWLADQVLTVEREVADAREVGDTGDPIALSAEESGQWLAPLSIDPPAIEGELPKTIQLALRWWKNDSPPQFTVSALGKKITGTFVRRRGVFSAAVPIKQLLDSGAARPIEIIATCDTLRAICPVVSASNPGHCPFLDRRGEGVTLLNPWYAIDIVANVGGGAIVGFRERARNVDHLATSMVTQKALDKAGHVDRVMIGNADKLAEAKLAFTIRQRELGCTRVEIDGVIDEGKNARSGAAYRLLDTLPLLVLRRDARLGEAKPDEKKKEPTDLLVPLQMGFRHASVLEGDGVWGSQIIAPDGDRLGVTRAMFDGEFAHRVDWRLKSGWALVHHPLRRQATLFLLDGGHAPELQSWAGADFLTLEPSWLGRPYRPPAGAAFTLGLSAGEVCGASLAGGWVACQANVDGQGVRCVAVAKLRDPEQDATAEFRLGREACSASLEKVFVEGIGDVHYAVASFPSSKTIQPLDAVVAGIPSRSKP